MFHWFFRSSLCITEFDLLWFVMHALKEQRVKQTSMNVSRTRVKTAAIVLMK